MKYFGLIVLTLILLSNADATEGDPVANPWVEGRSVLSLEHVITGVDSMHLRLVDIAFDGGSLLFGFALTKSAPIEIFVFLPNPKIGGTVGGRQVIVVGNHSHLSRFALAKPSDPLFSKFRDLIEKSTIGIPEELNNIESLNNGRQIINNVIEEFTPPVKWGYAALLQ